MKVSPTIPPCTITTKNKNNEKILRTNKKALNFLNKIIKGRELSCQPK